MIFVISFWVYCWLIWVFRIDEFWLVVPYDYCNIVILGVSCWTNVCVKLSSCTFDLSVRVYVLGSCWPISIWSEGFGYFLRGRIDGWFGCPLFWVPGTAKPCILADWVDGIGGLGVMADCVCVGMLGTLAGQLWLCVDSGCIGWYCVMMILGVWILVNRLLVYVWVSWPGFVPDCNRDDFLGVSWVRCWLF